MSTEPVTGPVSCNNCMKPAVPGTIFCAVCAVERFPKDDEIAAIQLRLEGLNLRERLIRLFVNWDHDDPEGDAAYAIVYTAPRIREMVASETRALRSALELAAEHVPEDCPHYEQIMAQLRPSPTTKVTADAPAPDVEDPQVPGPRRLPGEPPPLEPG